MRIFARRERPHPGAQLSLFETRDGWRYSLWATNQPTSWTGWRADPAYIDAAYRVHARVEDRIRTGKDCGLGRFPSHDVGINSACLATAGIAATWPWANTIVIAWARITALPHAPVTSAKPSHRSRKEPGGPWNRGHPARQPGHCHTHPAKSRSIKPPPHTATAHDASA